MLEHWVSKYSSRHVVANIKREIRQRRYTIVKSWIYFGDLYIAVEYNPDLGQPSCKFKLQTYVHRRQKYRVTYAEVYWTDESIDKYFQSKLSGRFCLDHNPGIACYGPWGEKKWFPVTDMQMQTNNKFVIITCDLTPKQFVSKVEQVVEENKLDVWSVFICHVKEGIGGYIVPRKEWLCAHTA